MDEELRQIITMLNDTPDDLIEIGMSHMVEMHSPTEKTNITEMIGPKTFEIMKIMVKTPAEKFADALHEEYPEAPPEMIEQVKAMIATVAFVNSERMLLAAWYAARKGDCLFAQHHKEPNKEEPDETGSGQPDRSAGDQEPGREGSPGADATPGDGQPADDVDRAALGETGLDQGRAGPDRDGQGPDAGEGSPGDLD